MNDKNDITNEAKALEIFRKLAENAAEIKESLGYSNLDESGRLVGERVVMIEELRAFVDAKVWASSSDIKDEMNLLMRNIQDDVTETMNIVREKSSLLLKEIERTRSAKKIAAYETQVKKQNFASRHGGQYGY